VYIEAFFITELMSTILTTFTRTGKTVLIKIVLVKTGLRCPINDP